MQWQNLFKDLERKIGTKRAAAMYYDLVFRFAPRVGVKCFNYGYAAIDAEASSAAPDTESFQLELYRQTALAAGEDRFASGCLLEISCGLGGGLAHVVDLFRPRLAIGVDLALPAVLSARQRFGLITVKADATDLRLPSDAFDVVINVEASHVYFGDAFLAEAARVLRLGGRFALTDNRQMSPESTQRWLTAALAPHGLRLCGFRDITTNVARACELDTPRRERLLARAPFFVRLPLRELLGGTTTHAYANLRNGRTTYFIATADKASAAAD